MEDLLDCLFVLAGLVFGKNVSPETANTTAGLAADLRELARDEFEVPGEEQLLRAAKELAGQGHVIEHGTSAFFVTAKGKSYWERMSKVMMAIHDFLK